MKARQRALVIVAGVVLVPVMISLAIAKMVGDVYGVTTGEAWWNPGGWGLWFSIAPTVLALAGKFFQGLGFTVDIADSRKRI
jgi:uncharacterized membrane protein